MLETPRLVLRPWVPEHLVALVASREAFDRLAPDPAADGLREFFGGPDVSEGFLKFLDELSAPDPWILGFAMIHRSDRRAIGTLGFKGPPDTDGMVEIAYGIVPTYEGQGLTTEATRAGLNFAFNDSRVRLIRAHTLPEQNASVSILKRLGFRHLGPVEDPEDGTVWRWELPRPEP